MKYIVQNENSDYVNVIKEIIDNRKQEIFKFFEEEIFGLDCKVYIYDSIESMINGLEERGFGKFPSYMCACQKDEDNSINYFIPKDNPSENEWSKDEYKKVIFHELIHAIEFNIYGKHPEWLAEGIATTLDGTYSKGIKNLLENYVNKIEIPNQKEIEEEFGMHEEYDSYDYAYLMVSYLIENYGKEEFLECLKNKEKFSKIYSKNLLNDSIEYFNKKSNLVNNKKNINVPKVQFEIMTLEDNINIILDFNKNFPNFDNYLYKIFPELNDINSKLSYSDKTKNIINVITKNYKLNRLKFETLINNYQKVWDKYNNKFMDILSNYLNI